MSLLVGAARFYFPRLRDRGKMALLGALLVVVPVFLVLTAGLSRMEEMKFMKDSRMVLEWEGFGPEKGMYNFTLVTAMLDIGRGNWSSNQRRSYNTYLLYMQRVLRLDVNMIVFINAKGRPFVDWMRRGREKRTRVVEITLEELPYYKYRNRMKEIMESTEYRQDNELVRKGLCEANIPEYDILQWSKLFFLHHAITTNPFSDNYFIWMDGGYGRGEDIHPPDGVWTPTRLFHNFDKVTFLEREPVDNYRQHRAYLHKMSINIVAGGFIAGSGKALERLYKLQQELLEEWMVSGVVDDDQTVYMQLYFKNPELFHFVRADWYDAFKLFDPRRRL